MALAFGGPSYGAEFFVDTLTDGVDGNPGDGVCGTATGLCSLRAAVQESNALAGEDTIHLGEGMHQLSLQAEGDPGPDPDPEVGDLDIVDDLQIVGAGRELTSVAAVPGSRIFDVQPDVSVAVRQIELIGGSASSFGGVVFNSGTLTLQDCIVQGGLVGLGSANSSGGGIYNTGDLTLRRCGVRKNSAGSISTRGAGIGNLGVARVFDSIIENNSVGGALTAALGGGISNTAPGSLEVEGSIVRDNHAQQSGGGIYSSGPFKLVASSVVGNDAGTGGGILLNGNPAEIVNSTIAVNMASGSGGGLALSSGELRLSSSTVRENLADSNFNGAGDGGGVFVSAGLLVVKNSVLAGNEDGGGDIHPDCSGPVTSAGYNLVLSSDGCSLTDSTTDLVGIDPMLGELTEGDRGTSGYPPQPGSPVVDAATPAGCTDAADALLVEDQNGAVRAFDGDRDGEPRCDIGAWELIPALIHRSGFEAGELPP